MNKQNGIDLLSSHRNQNLIALFIIPAFTIYALIALYPFENSLHSITQGIDDWSRYARFGLDIKQNGPLIPSVSGEYFAPAGFLYNYFLALCFSVFGENDVPVYVIQNIMLGSSVLLIFYSFRDKMEPIMGFLFLFTLTAFAFLDVAKYYSFRLLSENLTLFLISLFFFCSIKGLEKNKSANVLLAGVLLGLSVLSRPTLFVFALLFMFIAGVYLLKQQNSIIKPVLLVLLFGSTVSLLALRNYLVSCHFTFFPTEGMRFVKEAGGNFSFGILFKKILFCLGILSPLEPASHWRLHWVAIWLLYFAYLFYRIREKRNLELWEGLAHLYIFCYYGSLIVVAPVLNSYGFRLLIPGIFMVLPFAFMVRGRALALNK